MRLEKLNRRFANGGVDEQQMSNNLFAATNFKAFAPTIAAGLDLTQYSKDVKESEANRLAAFKDMKAADALMADQNKARELGAKYQSAFNEAHSTLRNPFDLTRFAQKQAVAYVNDPLRRNIEESSVNRKTSAALMAQDKNADIVATNGHLELDDYLHEKRGGTSDNVQSIRQVTPVVHNVNPAESLSKVANINYEDGNTWSKLNPAQQEFLYGMGISEKNWSKGTKQTRVNALVDLTLAQDPELKRSLEGHAFSDLKNDALNAGLSESDAKKYAYENLYNPKASNSAKNKMKALLTNAQTTMMHRESGNALDAFDTPLGRMAGKSGGPEQPVATVLSDDETVQKNKGDRTFTDDDAKLFTDDGKKEFNSLYSSLEKEFGGSAKKDVPELLSTVNKALKENPRANIEDIVKQRFGIKNYQSQAQGYKVRSVTNLVENVYKQMKRSQEIKDKLVNGLGYSQEYLKNPANAIEAMKSASLRDSNMQTDVFQGQVVTQDYLSKFVMPNLKNQLIKIGDGQIADYSKSVGENVNRWATSKEKVDSEWYEELIKSKPNAGGVTFQPDKTGKTITPMIKLTPTETSGDVKAGVPVYVSLPKGMRASMEPISRLLSQKYNPKAKRDFEEINLGNSTLKLKVIYKDGNPQLIGEDGREVPMSTVTNLIDAYLMKYHVESPVKSVNDIKGTQE